MATKDSPGVIKIKNEAQTSLLSFVRKVTDHHVASITEMHSKMDIIDRAYTRYLDNSEAVITDGGVDIRASDVSCDIFSDKDRVTPPIVVSQVDSFVSYLAEVYLTGTPLFPVVSTPATRKYAEQLETLMDDHAILGGYARQLLMFLRDSVKYNFAGVEVEWDSINQFSALNDFLNGDGRRLERTDKFFNRVRRLNPRNIIRDMSVLPGDVAEHGDYVGYVEKLSMTQLKRLLIKLQKQQLAFNVSQALNCGHGAVAAGYVGANLYKENPQVSNYVSAASFMTKTGVDWDAYADGRTGPRKNRTPSYGTQYEVTRLYARIIPSDHGITAPQANTPQIWRLIVVNNQVLVAAHRVITAYDYLPILLAQPVEDGFGEQTQSVAESEIPFQEAAGTLFNIRFSAARRAVSDRALYNSNLINPSHVNSKAAAPKIPVNISPLTPVSLDSVYKQIPFDMRGTETTIQDAQTIVAFSKELHGLNNPRMGQFQRGNKSVREWDDTMSGSDGRLRLPALTLEHQVFSPLKSMMALNIFQNGEDTQLVSQKTGDIVKININELRKQALSFRIADGYTPKSKIASSDMLIQGLQLIQGSPVLQQAYGPNLPGMFEHMMQLAGVRGLEEYNPKWQPPQQPSPAAGVNPLDQLNAASLTTGAAPITDPNMPVPGVPS